MADINEVFNSEQQDWLIANQEQIKNIIARKLSEGQRKNPFINEMRVAEFPEPKDGK